MSFDFEDIKPLLALARVRFSDRELQRLVATCDRFTESVNGLEQHVKTSNDDGRICSEESNFALTLMATPRDPVANGAAIENQVPILVHNQLHPLHSDSKKRKS
jgi:hypothetical protein